MKKHFITGLVILLPLAVTIMVIGFIINFLTQPFTGVVSTVLCHLHIADNGFLFLSSEQVIQLVSKILVLLFLFVFTIVLGGVMRWFFIRTAFNLGDRLLQHIPLVNTVYTTTREIIKKLFS